MWIEMVIFASLVLQLMRYLKKGKETEELDVESCLKEFKPEPLVNDCIHANDEKHVLTLDSCIDLVRGDFLSFSKHEEVRKQAAETIRTFGVGSCGPRAFYGTSEKHKLLEKKLAAFYNMEMALVYSCGSLTMHSVISVYLSNTDVAFVDESISPQIITGLRCSKCTVYKFKHNDARDLHTMLEGMSSHNLFKKFDARFLIIEGIYETSGSLCNLRDLLSVAKQFKVRVMMDESYSFGVLGATGRGITEYLNIEALGEIDIICASFECPFGTIGGFSVGSQKAIENQNILSLSFVYSASLSPFLVQTIITSMDNMEDRPITLQLFCREVHDCLQALSNQFDILSHFDSPIKVVVPKNVPDKDVNILQDEIIEGCIREYKVYMKANNSGICMLLNYNLFYNTDGKKALYKALKLAAKLVKKYQCTSSQ